MNDLAWDIVFLAVMPLIFLAMHLAQAQAVGRGAPVLYLCAGVGMVVWGTRKVVARATVLDRLKAGLDAETAVGQELDQLMRQGAAVFHDVAGERFNIDHVVVRSKGVFALETKGYTKQNKLAGRAAATVTYDGRQLQFPTWRTTKPLDQAARQAEWLSQWLSSAVGHAVAVIPVVALPGWFVNRVGPGGVWVYSGRQLSGLLRSGGSERLSPDEVQRVAHQLEQRCRTVAPLYGRNARSE